MIVAYRDLKQYRKKVAMVDGTFDPLHHGHIAYFRKARETAQPLLCNIASESYIHLKHPPLLAAARRAEVIDALKPIDYTHVSPVDTETVLRELQPTHYIKGKDWEGRLPPEQVRICRDAQIEIVYLDTVRESSTRLLRDFRAAELVSKAAGRVFKLAIGGPEGPPRGILKPGQGRAGGLSVPGRFGSSNRLERQPARERGRKGEIGAATAADALDGLLGYHLNPLTCGVAKFNLMFARRLNLPVAHVFDSQSNDFRSPLLSLKISEFAARDVAELERALDVAPWRNDYHLFLHAWGGTPIEARLLSQAALVYCGNAEIMAELTPARPDVVQAWCPWTLLEPQRFKTTDLSVFSFGMAHKVRSDLYRKLHALLERTGRSYSVFLSTALHEGTAFDESFTIVVEELRQIFGEHIYFLGYMSDTAVYNYVLDTTFFAAFFDKGVRANNTTVNGAMECGSVVITNLDGHSPESFVHGDNMLDIHACVALPTDEQELARLSTRARSTAREVLGWDALIASILQHDVQRTRKEGR